MEKDMANETKADVPPPPPPAATTPPAPPMRFERAPDFIAAYANNVQIETTAWDVTLVFGQFDKHLGENAVRQRASVTMAWPEMKAVCNLVLGNMAFYEAMNGNIKMPPGMTPPPPQFDKENPILAIVQDKMEKIRALLFG